MRISCDPRGAAAAVLSGETPWYCLIFPLADGARCLLAPPPYAIGECEGAAAFRSRSPRAAAAGAALQERPHRAPRPGSVPVRRAIRPSARSVMAEASSLMRGKRGLIIGVANNR